MSVERKCEQGLPDENSLLLTLPLVASVAARDLSAACGTHVEAPIRAPGGGGHVALGTNEALRPPQALQIRHARLLVREEVIELDEVTGVVDASPGLGLQRVRHHHNL